MKTYRQFLASKDDYPCDKNGWPQFIGFKKDDKMNSFVIQSSNENSAAYFTYDGRYYAKAIRVEKKIVLETEECAIHTKNLRALTESEFEQTQGKWLPTKKDSCFLGYNSTRARFLLKQEGFKMAHLIDAPDRQGGLYFNGKLVLGMPEETTEGTKYDFIEKHSDTICDCGVDLKLFIEQCRAIRLRKRIENETQKEN